MIEAVYLAFSKHSISLHARQRYRTFPDSTFVNEWTTAINAGVCVSHVHRMHRKCIHQAMIHALHQRLTSNSCSWKWLLSPSLSRDDNVLSNVFLIFRLLTTKRFQFARRACARKGKCEFILRTRKFRMIGSV